MPGIPLHPRALLSAAPCPVAWSVPRYQHFSFPQGIPSCPGTKILPAPRAYPDHCPPAECHQTSCILSRAVPDAKSCQNRVGFCSTLPAVPGIGASLHRLHLHEEPIAGTPSSLHQPSCTPTCPVLQICPIHPNLLCAPQRCTATPSPPPHQQGCALRSSPQAEHLIDRIIPYLLISSLVLRRQERGPAALSLCT